VSIRKPRECLIRVTGSHELIFSCLESLENPSRCERPFKGFFTTWKTLLLGRVCYYVLVKKPWRTLISKSVRNGQLCSNGRFLWIPWQIILFPIVIILSDCTPHVTEHAPWLWTWLHPSAWGNKLMTTAIVFTDLETLDWLRLSVCRSYIRGIQYRRGLVSMSFLATSVAFSRLKIYVEQTSYLSKVCSSASRPIFALVSFGLEAPTGS
jgi:hypothetical protein